MPDVIFLYIGKNKRFFYFSIVSLPMFGFLLLWRRIPPLPMCRWGEGRWRGWGVSLGDSVIKVFGPQGGWKEKGDVVLCPISQFKCINYCTNINLQLKS